MTNKKIVAGLLTGLAAGVVLTLALSSKKGRQSGKKILKGSLDIRDDLKGKFNDFIDQVQQKVHGILK
jgi:gas vesicle protein